MIAFRENFVLFILIIAQDNLSKFRQSQIVYWFENIALPNLRLEKRLNIGNDFWKKNHRLTEIHFEVNKAALCTSGGLNLNNKFNLKTKSWNLKIFLKRNKVSQIWQPCPMLWIQLNTICLSWRLFCWKLRNWLEILCLIVNLKTFLRKMPIGYLATLPRNITLCHSWNERN